MAPALFRFVGYPHHEEHYCIHTDRNRRTLAEADFLDLHAALHTNEGHHIYSLIASVLYRIPFIFTGLSIYFGFRFYLRRA
jgi:hypothetical protein